MSDARPGDGDSRQTAPAAPADPAVTDGSNDTAVANATDGDGSRDLAVAERLRDGLTGLAGGAVATVAMSAFRVPISRSPPPTAWFWATFLGDGEPGDYVGRSFVLHLLYGMGGGAVFGALVGSHLRGEEVNRERQGTALGAAYGVFLSLVGVSVILDTLLGMDLDDDERYVFDLGHLVYGLALGTWFGSRE